LEGDSLTIVKAITAKEPSFHRYGQIVEDIKLVLQSLRKWKVSHTKRDGNNAVHALAKEASRTVTDNTWIEEVPNCISNIVILEQSALSL
jgi:hypothetical protein